MKQRLKFVIFIFLCAGFGAGIGFGQEAQSLISGQTLEREMTGKATHQYKFDLQANEFFQARVEQKGVDVTLRLLDTDGKVLATMDSPNGREGLEILSFAAEQSGTYTLEVSGIDEKAEKGIYILRREAARTATANDRRRAAVEKTFVEAMTSVAGIKSLEQLDKTVTRLEEALRGWRELNDAYLIELTAQQINGLKKVKADEMLKVAFNLFDQGTLEAYQASLEKFQQAGKLYDEIGDRSENAGLLRLVSGLISNNLGRKQDALKFYNQALEFFQIIKDHNGEATTLNNIGLVYSDLGEKQKALEFYNQALPLYRQIGDKRGEATTLNNIGGIYDNLGEKQKALKFHNEALPLRRQANDKSGEAVTLNNIGSIYDDLGEKQKALEFYNQALPLLKQVGDKSSEATMLSNIGSVYADLGENQKALEFYNQTLPLRKQVGDKSGEAATVIGIGSVYAKLGEKQKALEFFNQALPLFRQVSDKSGEAETLNNIGVVYYALGEKQKALEFYNQALPLRRQVGDKSGEAVTLYNVMYVWNALNNRKFAVFYGKQSVNVYQQLRSNIKGLDKSIQQTYAESVSGTYRKLSDILIADGRILEAQAILDLLKDGEFSGATRRGGDAPPSVPYSQAEEAAIDVVNRLAALGREKNTLEEKNQKATLDETERNRFRELNKLIEIAEAEFQKSLAQLSAEKNKGDVYGAVVKEAQAFMSDLKELGGGTVALYTVVVNDTKPGATEKEKETVKTAWVILVTPEFRKAYPVDVRDLEKTVFDFRQTLTAPYYDPKPLAQTLYKKIFLHTSENQKTTLAADLDEYLKDKPNKNLMWSLDGILRYVPIAALHDGNQYLVEKFQNTIFNTASKPRLKNQMKTKWTALGLGVSVPREELGKRFAALPGTKSELLKIVRQSGGNALFNGVIQLDDQFTAAAMEDALVFDKNPLVHIASHFSFNAADFEDSFLLLGKGSLTVREFAKKSNLFANVDLLTLSACETAVADANGKDAEGFAYLAQSLGAKSVLATLWQVDDIGTQILMPEFYRLRETGMKKGEALRQAQIAMLNGKIKEVPNDLRRSEIVNLSGAKANLKKYEKDPDKPFAHPFYWSPFVLIGNWR